MGGRKTMSALRGLVRSWLVVAIGVAAAGCSASLVPPGDDAGLGANVADDAGRATAPVDAGAATDASESPPVGAIMYASPYNLGSSLLALSNEAITCVNRSPLTECSIDQTEVSFTVSIEIPFAEVVPGVYPLSSLINPNFSATGHNSDLPMSCWGGGGSFGDGTLEILSVSNTSVVFRFQDTDTFNFDLNGTTFVAQVCPGA